MNQNKYIKIIVVCVIIVVGGFAIKGCRDYLSFNDCLEQLAKLRSGMSHYVTGAGVFSKNLSVDDICNHLLPGHRESYTCKGLVKKKVDKVCEEDSFRLKIVDKNHYEIHAVAKGKKKCHICVTEGFSRPREYKDCSETPKCQQ